MFKKRDLQRTASAASSFKRVKAYVISIALALAVSGVAGILTRRGIDAYNTLIKPPLTPPSWVFPVVWTVLFALMGISAAIIFLSSSGERRSALDTYAAQLLVNFVWSVLFFNLQARLVAFFWLILLAVMIFSMIMRFYSISKAAAILQVPYLLWVVFAGYLNIAIWFLNR